MCPKLLAGVLLVIGAHAMAEERVLFDFEDDGAGKNWTVVNDGVMGGRSTGQFQIGEPGSLSFTGNLSLENNGGFASVRSLPKPLGLAEGDSLVVRTRGDGRTYTVNLYVPGRRVAFSYRTEIATKKDEWVEVTLPLSKFQATSFGRPVRNRPLDPTSVIGLGILLGDKKAGPFELEVDWIKVRGG